MKKMVPTFLFVFFFCSTAFAMTRHVPKEFPKINQAIQASSDGDTILVDPGQYYEHVVFKGKDVVLASHFILDSNLTDVSATIIDGSSKNNPDTGTAVIFQNQETEQAMLIGFTIQGGFGTLIGSSYIGGGILCRDNSSPTIRHNIIKDNNSMDGGGAAFVDSDPWFSFNQVIFNNALTGGGISLDNSRSEINRNIFAFNTATDKGGGIYILLSDGPVIKNSVFFQNNSGFVGGICCFFSFPQIIHNDFFDNRNGDFGDCVIGLGDATCCINFNQMACDKFYNIFRNPFFQNPTGANFTVTDSSPLIDAGSEASPGFPQNGQRIDIGPFEYSYLVGDTNLDHRFNLSDVIFLINYIFREGAFPKPIYSGDFNCDRRATIVDVTLMINYIFNHGPGPCSGI